MRLLRTIVLFCLLNFSAISVAQDGSWPVNEPNNWLLAFVDVETTGLTPGYHEMIDIGIVMTDLNGLQLDEFFLRLQPEYPERTEEGARAVNAFDENRWRELGAVSQREAVMRISEFHRSVADNKSVLMVAFNSHFDAAFLDHLFRSGDGEWRDLYHYFILDLPSMAWGLGFQGLTGSALSERFNVDDEPHVAELHTGITGARLNARLYRAMVSAEAAAEK